MSTKSKPTEQTLVVTHSLALYQRLAGAMEPLGIGVEPVPDAARLGRHRRARPFLLCFVDARGHDALACWQACGQQRPAERYVLILGRWQEPEAVASGSWGGGDDPFGYLREPFGSCEVSAWVRRAAEEARHRRGDQPLEELLYARFRHFLQNLGNQPMQSLHELVWEQVERPLINAVLERTGGNQCHAAKLLGIHRNTLRAKLRSLDIDPGRRTRVR